MREGTRILSEHTTFGDAVADRRRRGDQPYPTKSNRFQVVRVGTPDYVPSDFEDMLFHRKKEDHE